MIALVDEKIEAYATNHTSEESELLARLARETEESMKLPQMLTGRLEGGFLRLMVRALQARRILEVGMFTGYSALMMAEALPDDGRLVTCEVNPKAEKVARRYFAESPHGHKIDVRMGLAVETIKTLDGPFDFVFIDADKENYSRLLRALHGANPSGRGHRDRQRSLERCRVRSSGCGNSRHRGSQRPSARGRPGGSCSAHAPRRRHASGQEIRLEAF